MSKLLNCNIFFFIPFMYFFQTRLKDKNKKLSWFFIYIIPIMIMIFGGREWVGYDFFSFIIYILAIYTSYEMGYIWNDSETIKNEINPTKRLSELELCFYEEHKLIIYTFRFFILILLYFLIPEHFVFLLLLMLL